MKTVFVIGFLGTGLRSARYAQESTLIKVGHVGMAFEGDETMIYGFHPTAEAVQKVGNEAAVLAALRDGQVFEGILQADRAVFDRAAQLADAGAPTTVWEIAVPLADGEFDHIYRQTLWWYTERTKFSYAFPVRGAEMPTDRDNCATFPRRLGLPLPEATGQLARFVSSLESLGKRWKPNEGE